MDVSASRFFFIDTQRGAGEYKKCNVNMQDVVYLKNGDIIRGTIIEQIPGTVYKIQTKDKSIFAIKNEEIEKITKEPGNGFGETKVLFAWLLSFAWTGVGQIYNGQQTKGIAMLAAGVVLHFIGFLLKSVGTNYVIAGTIPLILWCIAFILWIVSWIDAIIVARRN